MELYKLRYNLYNYLIHNTTDYEITVSNKNIWFYGLISYYTFFIFILLVNYNKINLTVIIFIITGMFFLYYCYLLNIAIANIIDNKDFQDYVSYYKLLNAIFIDSYRNNIINNLITDVQYESDDKYMSLNSIMTTVAYFSAPITISVTGNYINDNSLLFAPASLFIANVILRNVDKMTDDVYLQITSGTFTLTLPPDIKLKCDILLIGGGGGGASRYGGGGGAGAMVYLTEEELHGTYTITIGAGGAGGAGGSGIIGSSAFNIANGANGIDTTINRGSTTIYIAKGGGGGGGFNAPDGQGLAGGSSGGSAGGRQIFSKVPVTNNVPSETYGNLGGKGSINVAPYWAGGGGGGAGGAGGNGIQVDSGTPFSGTGGIGREINITGKPTYYAGGGGGGLNHIYTPANGGLGGGGTGGNNELSVNVNQHAKANTGGGGGGGGYNDFNSGTGGSGGSGIVIIRFSRTYNKIINKLDYIIINTNDKYLRIIVHHNNEHYFIRNLVNNIYYKYHGNAYYNLDSTKIVGNEENIYGNIFMIPIDDNKIANNPKFYNDVIKYLHYRFKIKQNISGTITKYTARSTSSEYLNNFYYFMENIRTTIRNNENISIYDINNYIDNVIQDRDILRYIDIYDTSYNFLKKYIFIKNNPDDPLYDYINTNYETNKNYKISMVDTSTTDIIRDVIIKILKPIAAGVSTPPEVDYYLIDMETINNRYYNEEERKKNHNSINDYIVNIYNKLIEYYNTKYDLHIENFDVLYKENKRIDLIVKEKIKIYNYLFNIIIAIIIIILTIIMHVFFINIYYNY